MSRRKLTLTAYVKRRNGVPPGGPGALRTMLRRSFGARSFAGFWQHWNPIFGYYLGRYVFVPPKMVLPRPAALIITFIFTGIVHDLVTMAVRQDIAFFFTPWFFFLGTGAALSQAGGMDISALPWILRAAVHTGYLGVCLTLAVLVFTVR